MRILAALLAAAGALALAPEADAQLRDVLAPARMGLLQCYEPDLVGRTCSAISTYTPRADGGFDNGYRVLVADDPVIVMTGSSRVAIRASDGAVCGPLTRAELDAATFTILGFPASAEDSATLRSQLAEMPDFVADEVCTIYTPVGDGLRADVSLNGQTRLNNSARVIWVRVEDGYRVAPRASASAPQ